MGAAAAARNVDKRNKEVLIRNCKILTDCISKKSDTQVGNVKDLDVVMAMYNLIETTIFMQNIKKSMTVP